jgi:F-type H+-transporting ATPase subunit epsilon
MKVSVVSPEQVLFEGEAMQVITRTTEGDVAFLADHAPFLGTLVAAETRVYLTDGSIQRFDLPGGFVEVSGNSVTILAT